MLNTDAKCRHPPDIIGFVHCVYCCVNDASQVVQSGGKNIELAVIRRNQPLKVICSFFFFFL